MAVSKVKLRMFYIMKILFEKSDERHALSANDINRLLQNYGMEADCKTVYSDIETLREFHIDIIQEKEQMVDIISAAENLNYQN